jgi:hypothetical protein
MAEQILDLKQQAAAINVVARLEAKIAELQRRIEAQAETIIRLREELEMYK